MKILLIALSLCLPFAAYAEETVPSVFESQEVHFSYSSLHNYYSCDYVKSQATALLSALGARNAQVDCRGGLPHSSHVRVQLRFSAASPALDGVVPQENLSWQRVSFAGQEGACEFNEQLFKNVLSVIPSRNVVMHNSCWNFRGGFKYRVEVLK